ncbi:hypothetical protein [Undibacterium sp. Ji22W]|uniref:hypothetical protein n=1 Tax=Undibacterium sp. Ji22W TaxID=3413038 RepID=UPI003BEFF8DA
MALPRVYADFNSLEYVNEDGSISRLGLTGYGTISSLARQQLRLVEGMPLIFFEANEIEVQGFAHFDNSVRDPAGRIGAWFGVVDQHKVKNVDISEEANFEHPCSHCRASLNEYLKRVGQQYNEYCPNCGTSVMAPLSPPEKDD